MRAGLILDRPQSAAASGALNLEEALRLLRHAGHGAAADAGVSDVAALQAVIDGLCELSSRDGLTGLANLLQFRLVLDRELDRVARTGEPLSLLLLDIDHFKSINDRHGHPAGDRVLKTLASLLESGVRPMDTVARIGGEEFAAVLPSSQLQQACRVAGRLLATIENARVFLDDGTPLPITLSCGVAAVAPWAGVTSMALIAAADGALYAAKEAGRNCVRQAGTPTPAITPEERAALLDPNWSSSS